MVYKSMVKAAESPRTEYYILFPGINKGKKKVCSKRRTQKHITTQYKQ